MRRLCAFLELTRDRLRLGDGQAFCGMSVVDGADWDGTKRFNINEMYKLAPAEKAAASSK